MLSKIREKLVDKIAEYTVILFIGLFGFLFNGYIFDDPFYHKGWMQENKAWFLLFVVLLILGIMIAGHRYGAIILMFIAVVMAIFFGLSYKNSDYDTKNWRTAIWISHWIAFVALVPVVGKIVVDVLRKLKRW